MLVQEPEGITIGTPGSHDFRKRRASASASSRSPSLNGACPQQKARRTGRTLTRNPSSTAAAACGTAGKNCSARQVLNSRTSVIRRPQHERVKLFGTMHANDNQLFDVGGATRTGDEGDAMVRDGLRAKRDDRLGG